MEQFGKQRMEDILGMRLMTAILQTDFFGMPSSILQIPISYMLRVVGFIVPQILVIRGQM